MGATAWNTYVGRTSGSARITNWIRTYTAARFEPGQSALAAQLEAGVLDG